jgi:hypothetical protein
MSGGAGMIAVAVVQRVAGMLGDVAWERVKLLWNFKGDVQEMEIRMGDLKVVLRYADKRSRETDSEPVHHWLKKYKHVAYDIEDALDELEADAMIWKNSPCTVHNIIRSPHICMHVYSLPDWRDENNCNKNKPLFCVSTQYRKRSILLLTTKLVTFVLLL